MSLNMLKNAKNRLEKYKELKDQEKLRKKEEVIKYVITPMSEEVLESEKISLYLNSMGYLGLDFDEEALKWYKLEQNRSLFTHEEHEELCKTILSDIRVKNRI